MRERKALPLHTNQIPNELACSDLEIIINVKSGDIEYSCSNESYWNCYSTAECPLPSKCSMKIDKPTIPLCIGHCLIK